MICSNCDYAGRPPYKSPCSECDKTIGSPFCRWEREEKPTNADKIRTMSDKDLTTLVRALIRTEDCPALGNPDCEKCFFYTLCTNSVEYFGRELEWLQQTLQE